MQIELYLLVSPIMRTHSTDFDFYSPVCCLCWVLLASKHGQLPPSVTNQMNCTNAVLLTDPHIDMV